jgi:2-oxoglutarate ferredoxin oxidoreductase subunit alpha
VLDADALEKIERYGRFLDVDGDGITYRTIPGTHPTKGAFVARGTSRDEYAVYTEDGAAYQRNVDRLTLKWNTAKTLVPEPHFYQKESKKKDAMVFFGTSTYAAEEAIELLKSDGMEIDSARVRSFPFTESFREFVESHDRIFVVEQNRDAQFRSLMMMELGAAPDKLVSILKYDGTPITADHIYTEIKGRITK